MNAALARPRIGLLAGGGRFPFVVAEAARRQGAEVVCVALRDHADPEIEAAVDRIYWMGLGKLGRMIRVSTRRRHPRDDGRQGAQGQPVRAVQD